MRVILLLGVVVFVLEACAFQVIEKQYTPVKSANWDACLSQCQSQQKMTQVQRDFCNITKRVDMELTSIRSQHACDPTDAAYNHCMTMAKFLMPRNNRQEYAECNDEYDTEETYDTCYVNCGGSIEEVCVENCDEAKK